MSGFGDYLAEVAETAQAGATFVDAEVTGLASDGTVNLNIDGALVTGVPALRSYTNRKVGDLVICLQQQSRTLVLGAIGASDQTEQVAETTVKWGDGVPTGDWEVDSGNTVYVRDNEIYIRTAVAPVKPSPASRVYINPIDDRSYQDGSIEPKSSKPHPAQGAWFTYPRPITGAWFYGTAIEAACAGRSVRAMYIDMERGSSGGDYGRVKMKLYLHGNATPPTKTPVLSNYWSGAGSLQPREVKSRIQLPSSWVTALASGSKRGVGCTAGIGNSEYLIYGDCGRITIEFNGA